MITVNIRKQGGAAVFTIPSDVLKLLNIGVGSTLELNLAKDGFTARPIQTQSRYSLAELLHGVTKKDMDALNKETKWARSGKAVGRELP